MEACVHIVHNSSLRTRGRTLLGSPWVTSFTDKLFREAAGYSRQSKPPESLGVHPWQLHRQAVPGEAAVASQANCSGGSSGTPRPTTKTPRPEETRRSTHTQKPPQKTPSLTGASRRTQEADLRRVAARHARLETQRGPRRADSQTLGLHWLHPSASGAVTLMVTDGACVETLGVPRPRPALCSHLRLSFWRSLSLPVRCGSGRPHQMCHQLLPVHAHHPQNAHKHLPLSPNQLHLGAPREASLWRWLTKQEMHFT